MMFLAPLSGFIDDRFGILATPDLCALPSGVAAGMTWAADNGAFTNGFRPDVFFSWLAGLEAYRSKCLFVVCPDCVGDAAKTLELFDEWHEKLAGWPVAFVAQDGQEDLEFPPSELWSTLFVGGTTLWKMSSSATQCILRAQALGKRIHIGRVNYFSRYRHFASLQGSERFTCDGTRQRFEGSERALAAWRKYMDAPKQYGLFVPYSDSGSESCDN